MKLYRVRLNMVDTLTGKQVNEEKNFTKKQLEMAERCLLNGTIVDEERNGKRYSWQIEEVELLN